MKNFLKIVMLVFFISLFLTACTTPTPSYTVTFNTNGGTTVASVKVVKGETVDEPEAPERTGYTFDGWYIDDDLTDQYDFESVVSSATTLYAKWTPVTVTVTFDLGYEGATPIASQEITYPSEIVEPAIPIREFYAFTGWTLGGDEFDFTTSVTVDTTLVAGWTCDYVFTTENGEVTITDYVGTDSPDELSMPDSLNGNPVTAIGGEVFMSLTSLTSIDLPSSLEIIGLDVFNGCSSLSEIDIPDTVTSIGIRAFKNCSTLSLVNLPSSLVTIYDNAFENCIALVSIVIPENTVTIGNHAFLNCITLGSVIIGESVETIGESAFYGCTGILSITIPDSVQTIGNRAFARCLSLISLAMGNGITAIGEYAFESCSDMTDITFGSSLTTINAYAFLNCSGLLSVTIPDSVTVIGTYAFSGCIGLSDIVIGSGVTEIGSQAFSGCLNLEEITMRPITAPSLGTNVFYNIDAGHMILIRSGSSGYNTGLWLNYNVEIFYVVLFDIGYTGGVNPPVQNVPYQGNATAPVTPVRPGYYFQGWYSDLAKTTLFDFDTEITSNKTLYGKWTEMFITSVADNRVTILGLNTGVNPTNITVPSTLLGNTVFSIGDNAFSDNITVTHITLPSTIEYIGNSAFANCLNAVSIRIGDSVKEIGDYAFLDCKKITSMNIPDTATQIGIEAFRGCTMLSDMIMGDNVINLGAGAFTDCVNLETVTLNEGLEAIYENTFSTCSKLLTIAIPSSVEIIGSNAFLGCSSLTTVSIPSGVTEISDAAFKNCSALQSVTLSFVLETLGNEVFSGCSALNNISLPSSITSIGDYVFNNCSSLTSITLPVGITEIGQYSFFGCSGLVSISIQSDITSVGERAFSNTGLVMINLGDAVTSIGDYAFSGCSALTNINLPNTVTTIGTGAFMNSGLTSFVIPSNENLTAISLNTFKDCLSLASITISDNITSIGDYAFSYCESLIDVVIPESVITIGNYSFENCSELDTVTFGNATQTIGNYAFTDCVDLIYIVLPEDLTFLGSNAFEGCVSMTSAEMSDTLTIIREYTFRNCTSLTSVVLSGNLTVIGEAAFYNCDIINLDIPASINTIGVDAFIGNDNLVTVIVRAINAPTVGTIADPFIFEESDDMTVYIPYGAEGYDDIDIPYIDLAEYWSHYNKDVFYIVSTDFNYGGAPVGDEYTVLNGGDVYHPTDPVCPGGTFLNWSYDEEGIITVDFENDVLDENKVLYAIWDLNSYEVCFDLNGGEGVAPSIQYVDYGELADIPETPVKTGYHFVGWFLENECINGFNLAEDFIVEDTELYAGWEINVYSVSFDLNGGDGEAPETQAIEYQSLASQPLDPVKTENAFVYWTLNGGEYDFNTPVTENITLIAEWDPNDYTVTYNFSGYGDETTAVFEYGDLIEEPVTVPSSDSCYIYAWCFDSGLTEYVTFGSDTVEGDLTIYAEWNLKEIAVRYFINYPGGNPLDYETEITSYGYTIPSYSVDSVIAYSFDGFYYDEGFTQIVDFENDTVTANTDVYGKWTKTHYIVTFSNDGGSSHEDILVLIGDTMPELPVPALPDTAEYTYTFIEWRNLDTATAVHQGDEVTDDIDLIAVYTAAPIGG